LQDIYFHIDVLRYPERYRAVLDEIRSRGLQPVSGVEPELVPQDIPQWIHTLSALQHRPLLAAALSALLLLGYTALMTFLFCLPIYLLAVPFKALNQQGALFYLLSFPFAPLTAAGFGRRAGGRGWYALAVAAGVALGVAAFVSTGTLQIVVQALFDSRGAGGFSWPGGY
ncbi:MAG: hypothetical protein NZ741_08740, partial [Armatimonadetes bacterium]|nr:hypothetical protein [Armatimonadota bacterium]